MRITGGRARSISLNCPKGEWVRPATDRMRESVFSSLGSEVESSVFLDLFAGSGSYGMEAISRGAKSGTFVEQHRAAVGALKKNLDQVTRSVGSKNFSGIEPFVVESQDVFSWIDRAKMPIGTQGYDLVFIDPPYKDVEGSFARILEGLTPLLNQEEGAWILFESPVLIETYPKGYQLKKTFGKGREDTRAMLLSWLPNR